MMGNDGNKLDMTDEELEKFKEAMKKEEFRKLLGEYAQELADPVKRAEYEAELVQLESERGVDMKFIKPEPGYVIKGFCKIKQEKCFINVCTSPEIDKPEFTTSTQNGQTGQSCSLPYSLSPMHKEKDHKDVECDVYDVVFHPEVLMRCQNPKFKEMVTDTALDAVIKDLRVDVDKTEVKFPKMKFKGKPAESVIRKRVAAEDPDTFSHLPKGRPEFPPVPGEEKKAEKKSKDVPGKKRRPADEPEYRIVYRDNVDMGNFTNDRVAAVAPSHLIVYISLPKYSSAANVDLDVYRDQLELHSKDYNLVLDLPYGVDSDNGKAKFDKQKKELSITLETVKKEMTNGFSEHNGDCPSTSHHEEGETAPELNDIDLGKLENKLIEELNSEEPPAFLLSPEPNQENGLPSQEESEPNLTLSDISISLDTPSSQDKPLDTPLHSAHSANPVPLIQLSTLPDQTSPISSPQIEHISSKPTSNIEKIKPEPIPESPITSVPTPQPLKNKPNLPGLQLNSELSSADSSPSPVGNVVQAGVTPPSSPRLFKVAPVVSQCINMDCKSDILCYDSNCLNSTVQSPEQRVEVSVKKESIDEETLLDDVWRTDDDCSSCMSGYTDATVDDLNVQIRVYQDLVSATLILDTLMVEKPKIKVSGKKMWIDSEDLSLYVLLPHLITSHTITVSKANVCIVLYKQHNALWGNLHIGHTKEEVFSYKFITEENTEILVESFGDPWYEATEYKLSTQCRTSSESTCVEYTVECPSNNAIPIIRQDSESEDVFPKGILKSISPHSPPPLSPRCRKVSFNEEVETFVLPSKRSLKRKGRRKKKNSNSESDFSDSCESLPSPSSPGPHSPVFSSDFELSNVQQNSHASANEMSKLKGNTVVDRSAPPPSPPSEPSSPPSSPSSSPEANSTEHNKENVMQTQQEVVKAMDPSGADSHKMLLTNSLIYELDD